MTVDAYGVSTGPRIVYAPRCECGRRLAEYLAVPYSLRCPRCKASNRAGATLTPTT